jgi:DNA-binding response OmpR family regulator
LAEATAPEDELERPDRELVLVVEDNADLRRYLRAGLERRYRVIEASDGTEGLERARASFPDLVVCDVVMPRLDGLGTIAALRADPDTTCTPIVLLTSKGSTDDRIAGLDAGADDYLVKPFHTRELLARIARLIETRQALRRRWSRDAAGKDVAAQGNSSQRDDPTLRNSFLERFDALVQASLADPELSVEALARGLHVSRAQLFRKVGDAAGETPGQRVRRARLEEAKQLLADVSLSISEVAYGVGFGSRSHFARCFRDEHGLTPGLYRDRLRSRARGD